MNAREIGVVFGQRSQLWWDLPVINSFLLNEQIYGIPEMRFQDNLARYTKLLELDSFLDRAVRQLSLGQRMRCELVMALYARPPRYCFSTNRPSGSMSWPRTWSANSSRR